MEKLVFDIGASNTKYALMNTEAEILTKDKFPTVYDTAEAFLNSLVSIAGRYAGSIDEIAISTNGRMSPDGSTYRAYIPKILVNLNLKKEMENRTGLPVTVLNDGFSAALGEWWKGSGQGCKNLLVAVLGSGMGSGLILDGKLYRGEKQNAAMIFGMMSTCGKDRYELSGFTTSFLFLLYQLSALKQIPMQEMTGERFFDLAAQGDTMALGLLDTYCENIASVVFNAAVLLDLDAVVITGGLSEQPLILDTVNRKLREIPQKALDQSALELLKSVGGDLEDLNIQGRKGALSLDANLYGALYQMLHKE